MKLDDFNLTDNGDGTFTLAPKDPSIETAELVTEYRRIRDRALALLATRDDINTELQALAARRDELRTLATTAGVADPDDDQTP